MTRTRRSFALLAVALAVPRVPARAGKRDKDCDDFKSQKKAQRFFERHGGPRKDPHDLDADGDGVACEELD